MIISDDGTFPVEDQQEVWDNEYRKKGRLWGNVPLEETAYKMGGIFLDLGCGDGKNLRRITTEDNIRIGLDFSSEALSLCRNNPELNDVSFICSNALNLPFKKNSVQYVDAHHILSHLLLDERIQVAKEISAILSPGGRIMVTVFGKEDFRYGAGITVEPDTFLKGNGIITHYFSPEEFHSLFPELIFYSQKKYSWSMKVKGTDHQRCVWTVVYTKKV
ncbi:class I SAM-dependent methyltransferase [Methanospirillum stamsii]|uniref:Class I SAM-dependent methyltransferase n=1 Tax=Methanospirillum stamsii TaxID=1277351 RepID=A0A2V2N539_9EURY|nr:class I SAM-dependent methyltransferase [Methanospirillum stamsii]PWR74939.1 class I SAM-dependent methyltransferase [Methanospirillum stamsii]